MMNTIRFFPLAVNVVFLFLLSFYISSNNIKTAQSAIYEPRTTIIIGFLIFSLIYKILNQGKNLSLLEYISIKIKQIKFSKGIAFVILVSASAFLSPMSIVAWIGHDSSQFGTLMLFFSIAILLIFSTSDIESKHYIIPLSCCVLIMTLLALIESVGFRPMVGWIASPRMVYPAATIGLRQHLGGWFAIMALQPIFFYRYRRKDIWFYIWIVSGLIGAAVCTTSAATIGLLISLTCWILFENGKTRIMGLMILFTFIISALFLPSLTDNISNRFGNPENTYKSYKSTTTLNTRLILWKAAVKGTIDKPLLGWGSQTFATFLPNLLEDKDLFGLYRLELGISDKLPIRPYIIGYEYKHNGKWKHFNILYIEPHSALFSEFYSRGIPSTLLLISIIILHLKKYNRKYLSKYISAFFPYLFYLLFWFYLPHVTPMYFALIGIAHKDMTDNATKRD